MRQGNCMAAGHTRSGGGHLADRTVVDPAQAYGVVNAPKTLDGRT
jgi:hypothetical protein